MSRNSFLKSEIPRIHFKRKRVWLWKYQGWNSNSWGLNMGSWYSCCCPWVQSPLHVSVAEIQNGSYWHVSLSFDMTNNASRHRISARRKKRAVIQFYVYSFRSKRCGVDSLKSSLVAPAHARPSYSNIVFVVSCDSISICAAYTFRRYTGYSQP